MLLGVNGLFTLIHLLVVSVLKVFNLYILRYLMYIHLIKKYCFVSMICCLQFCFLTVLRNWMNLRDADSGKVLWQGSEDL